MYCYQNGYNFLFVLFYRHLQKLIGLISTFPEENPKEQDIVDLLSNIRAKFKHCCAILKVDASYNSKAKLNF